MTLAAKVRAPGWYRVAIGLPLAFAFSICLVCLLRELYGYDPVLDWSAITTVALISMPLAFIVAIGCFDYWFRWASGAPTVPEDQIVDPTGVGDAFRGGFLTGYSRGFDWRLCGEIGSLAAVYCLEQRGPQGHGYTREDFVRRFRCHFDDEGRLDAHL